MTPAEAAQSLADLIARRRNGPVAYMDGSEAPLPQDHVEAQRFIRDLIDNGWLPPLPKGRQG